MTVTPTERIYESFLKTSIDDYFPFGYSSPSELIIDVTSIAEQSSLILDAYSVEGFTQWNVNWDEKPEELELLSQTFISNTGIYTIPIGSPETKYIKLKTDTNLQQIVFNQLPSINHYILKSNQEDGFAYVQTDVSETLNLRSSVYSTDTNVKEGDKIRILCRAKTSSEVKLQLFDDSNFEIEFVVLPSGNNNFQNQLIELKVPSGIDKYFDQLMFTGIFNDKEYFVVYDVEIVEK